MVRARVSKTLGCGSEPHLLRHRSKTHAANVYDIKRLLTFQILLSVLMILFKIEYGKLRKIKWDCGGTGRHTRLWCIPDKSIVRYNKM